MTASPHTLPAVAGDFDTLLHAGDFAYDLDTDSGRVGDGYMRQLQPIIAQIPYNGVRGRPLLLPLPRPRPTRSCRRPFPSPSSSQIPGNHESANNFTHYKARFASVAEAAGAHSGSGTNMFYSVVDGLTHFLFWVREAVEGIRGACSTPSSTASRTSSSGCAPLDAAAAGVWLPAHPPAPSARLRAAAGHGGVLGAAARLPDSHGELAQGRPRRG